MRPMLTKKEPQKLIGWHNKLKGILSPGLRGEISPDLWGDISGLWGEISSGLQGNVSGLRGDCTNITGKINDCELTIEERKEGVAIETLIKKEEVKK